MHESVSIREHHPLPDLRVSVDLPESPNQENLQKRVSLQEYLLTGSSKVTSCGFWQKRVLLWDLLEGGLTALQEPTLTVLLALPKKCSRALGSALKSAPESALQGFLQWRTTGKAPSRALLRAPRFLRVLS